MSLSIQPLPLLRNSGSTPLQAVRVRSGDPQSTADAQWTLLVTRGAWNQAFALHGREDEIILIPEADVPVDTTFTAIRTGSRSSVVIRMAPVRRWTVHLVLHSHTDLGFTGPVSDVAQLHNENTDRAIAYCRETAHFPEGLRFKWTCEVSWQVQNYLRDRSPEQIGALMELVRNETIAIGALYSGELTELLGHEEAVRSFAYAGFLRQRYGIPCDTALLCDVPGCTAGFVQIMAKSGVRSLIIADNNFIAPFLPRTDLPRPFIWTGDDRSSVLCWYTDHPFYAYVEGEHYGFLENRGKVEQMLGEKLLTLEAQGYPYNRYQIQYAFDNAPITFVPAQIVQEWALYWDYPKIVLSTAREFLRAMRREHAARLPRRTGDWTDWWGGIVAGFPADEMLTRQYHLRTPAVETLAAFLSVQAGSAPIPDPRIARAYDGLLAFDEHSGGGNIWQPKSRDEQERALREGYGFLHSAIADVDAVQQEALENLPGQTARPGSRGLVGVYNPSGMLVSREITINHDSAEPYTFFARDIPPHGCRLFSVEDLTTLPHAKPETDIPFPEPNRMRLGNASLSIEIDTTTGRWVSLRDTKTGAEYVSPGASINTPAVYQVRPVRPFELGKFIPELYDGTSHPGDFLTWPPASRVSVVRTSSPSGTTGCRVEHSVDGIPWLRQEYRITPDSQMVSAATTLLRTCVTNDALRKELGAFLHPDGMLYMCFPFAVAQAEFLYESVGRILRPPGDQLPGTCLDFVAVQRWCALHGRQSGILVVVHDTPLLDIGSVGLHKYKVQADADPSSLFFRAVTLRDWGGPDESPYTRDRDFVFRYDVSVLPTGSSAEPDFAFRAEAHRRAVHQTTPLLTFTPEANVDAKGPEGLRRFLSIAPDTIELLTFKPAESGKKWILRLREVTGAASTATVRFLEVRIRSCHNVLMTEEPEETSAVTGERQMLTHTEEDVTLSFTPFAIRTLALELEPAFGSEKGPRKK